MVHCVWYCLNAQLGLMFCVGTLVAKAVVEFLQAYRYVHIVLLWLLIYITIPPTHLFCAEHDVSYSPVTLTM
jgi:hypothetical protein